MQSCTLCSFPKLNRILFCSQKTPLYWSSCRGHIETSRLLIKSNADINARNIECRPYIQLHILFSKSNITDREIIFCSHYRTPLHVSSCCDHVEICKLLIACKADVAAKNRCRRHPCAARAFATFNSLSCVQGTAIHPSRMRSRCSRLCSHVTLKASFRI